MSNPYDTLGVNPSATDEEIKDTYRELAKKYHPDNYADSPLQEFADEKMREINAAFDDIMNDRRKNGNAGYRTSDTSGSASSYGSYKSGSAPESNFADIRAMIQANRLVDAEELLDGIPLNSRDAEWYFLKGSIYYSRGWLDDAQNNFATACKLNPNNAEYRAALNRMGWQQQGNMGGYGQGAYRAPNNMGSRGCTPCDVCQGLICADCCCNCMGGDFISCC